MGFRGLEGFRLEDPQSSCKKVFGLERMLLEL